MSEQTETSVRLAGMHCASCATHVRRRLESVPGIVLVDVDFGSGTARLTHRGVLDLPALDHAVAEDGYRVLDIDQTVGRMHSRSDYVAIGTTVIVLSGAFLLLREVGFAPRGFGLSDDMSLGLVFVIGLIASVSSCIAVTGGLLVAISAKYAEATVELSPKERLKPLIAFNAGRLASYALFGAVIGGIGSTVALSPRANGILTIVSSTIMVLLGLQMLRLLPPMLHLAPGFHRWFSATLRGLAGPQVKAGAFALGAATFFLPCAFTQALQLYVLSAGGAALGAATMLVFALGTLPALLSLSALSSIAEGRLRRHFVHIAGVAVILLAVVNVRYGAVLTQDGLNAQAQSQDSSGAAASRSGSQEIAMRVEGYEYQPRDFSLQQNVPVIWRIDASGAEGCGRILMAPGLGIQKLLSANGTSIVAFTPKDAGTFEFNCSMGMMTPGKITVRAGGQG